MTTPIIEVRDLCFSYSGKEVLHGIDLSIPPLDFVVVIGPNGSGKTTLIKLILGLLQPTRGEILLRGKPLPGNDTAIGYVPQQINHSIHFPATALDVVLMGTHSPNKRFSFVHSHKDRKDALEALERMAILHLASRKITDLSGGQRQRVLIARALVAGPDLLVLDEPTANIDTTGQSEFYTLLKQVNEELTIFMVTHDLFTISSYAKSVACVNKRLFYQPMFFLHRRTDQRLSFLFPGKH